MGKRNLGLGIEGCPVEAALDLIGGKWKGVVMYHLIKDEKLRFGELKRRLKSISQRVLTKQLRELERDELVHRKIFAEIPPHVEYSLTSKGNSLKEVISALEIWGQKHRRSAKAG